MGLEKKDPHKQSGEKRNGQRRKVRGSLGATQNKKECPRENTQPDERAIHKPEQKGKDAAVMEKEKQRSNKGETTGEGTTDQRDGRKSSCVAVRRGTMICTGPTF